MPRVINEIDGVRLFAESRLPFGDDLPLLSDSIDLLKTLKNKKITDVFRFFDVEAHEYLNYPFEVPASEIFTSVSGVLFFLLDTKECIGFCQSTLNLSILVWQEKLPMEYDALAGKFRSSPTKEFKGSLINYKNEKFGENKCANIIGKKIEHLTIYKVNEPGGRSARNERGLLIALEGDTEFLISMRMQENCSFAFLREEKIKESLRDQIYAIEV
ncbi:hypothetical protein [Undibacterium sp. TS12]|uniref:hypothetical protein n=1 Tax=Undibacterium sp. TS12 TaxID=2908202 RepID=UPI001F4CA24D|nr:hypothetical protein [Undibacterium sp. TS12]MCH8618768.1 hypothetical protein [Undibacterium sp. TS12]